MLFQAYKSGQVDDSDGHYIVVPDAELTENCELSLGFWPRNTSD